MQLDQQQKLDKEIQKYNFITLALVFGLEVCFRALLIMYWNYVTSSELNKFLFGSEALGMIKGICLSFVVQFLFSTKGLIGSFSDLFILIKPTTKENENDIPDKTII